MNGSRGRIISVNAMAFPLFGSEILKLEYFGIF
jgi:hypothetical protein